MSLCLVCFFLFLLFFLFLFFFIFFFSFLPFVFICCMHWSVYFPVHISYFIERMSLMRIQPPVQKFPWFQFLALTLSNSGSNSVSAVTTVLTALLSGPGTLLLCYLLMSMQKPAVLAINSSYPFHAVFYTHTRALFSFLAAVSMLCWMNYKRNPMCLFVSLLSFLQAVYPLIHTAVSSR